MLDVSVSSPIGATDIFHKKLFISWHCPFKEIESEDRGSARSAYSIFEQMEPYGQNLSSTTAQAKLVARLFSKNLRNACFQALTKKCIIDQFSERCLYSLSKYTCFFQPGWRAGTLPTGHRTTGSLPAGQGAHQTCRLCCQNKRGLRWKSGRRFAGPWVRGQLRYRRLPARHGEIRSQLVDWSEGGASFLYGGRRKVSHGERIDW